jgi:hypothetical protein
MKPMTWAESKGVKRHVCIHFVYFKGRRDVVVDHVLQEMSIRGEVTGDDRWAVTSGAHEAGRGAGDVGTTGVPEATPIPQHCCRCLGWGACMPCHLSCAMCVATCMLCQKNVVSKTRHTIPSARHVKRASCHFNGRSPLHVSDASPIASLIVQWLSLKAWQAQHVANTW